MRNARKSRSKRIDKQVFFITTTIIIFSQFSFCLVRDAMLFHHYYSFRIFHSIFGLHNVEYWASQHISIQQIRRETSRSHYHQQTKNSLTKAVKLCWIDGLYLSFICSIMYITLLTLNISFQFHFRCFLSHLLIR